MKKLFLLITIGIMTTFFVGCSGIKPSDAESVNCGLASVIIVAIVIFFFVLAKKTNILRDEIGDCDVYESRLINAAHRRDEKISSLKRPYSLSRTQLAVWTTVISSTYIYQVLCHNCVGTINVTALVLMGISTGTTAIASLVDTNDIEDNKLRHQDQPSKGFFIDILSDSNGVSIHRFQNLIWSIIAIIIYVYKLNNSILSNCLPELDTTLLALTGISNATYLTLKGKENSNPANALGNLDASLNKEPINFEPGSLNIMHEPTDRIV
jgi:hypothetical protein